MSFRCRYLAGFALSDVNNYLSEAVLSYLRHGGNDLLVRHRRLLRLCFRVHGRTCHFKKSRH